MLSRWMQAGLLLTLLALLAGGLWLHRVQAEAMRFEVERELTAIARLKAHQISEWRADQLEDAATLSQDPYLLTAISTFLAAPTAEHRSDLRGRLALHAAKDLARTVSLNAHTLVFMDRIASRARRRHQGH